MDFNRRVYSIISGTKVKVDEDEGSPLRGGVNSGRPGWKKIERSADALRGCHTPRKLSLQL